MMIKICGLTRAQDISAVNEALPDFVGFVFAKSRRQVTLKQAKALKELLDPRIRAVGVFVDAEPALVQQVLDEGIIDLVQLHGQEDEAYIARMRAPVIKALRLGQHIPENADYLLFDSPAAGSGQTFDWSRLPNVSKPYFLAGGINATNVAAAKALLPFGIDVSSGVETNGVKDRDKIIDMVRRIRHE